MNRASKACMLALATKAHDFLKSPDSADFLRAARALSLHFPPIQRVANVSERTWRAGAEAGGAVTAPGWRRLFRYPPAPQTRYCRVSVPKISKNSLR